MTAPMILMLDDHTRAHLARALSDYLRACKVNGYSAPPALMQMAATLAASGGQARPPRADAVPPADSGPVALRYDQAAHRLGVSPRTVRRLVASQELPTIDIHGCKRVTREAVDEYIRRKAEEGKR